MDNKEVKKRREELKLVDKERMNEVKERLIEGKIRTN